MREFDVVVIGAGVAGTAAALAAARSGARVCVAATGPAATALFSGAWRGACPDELRSALADVGYELHKSERTLPHVAGSLFRCHFTTRSHDAARVTNDAAVCGIAGLPGFHAATLARLWSARAGVTLTSFDIALEATPRAGWAPASLAAAIERDSAVLTQPLREAVRTGGVKAVIIPAVLGLDACDAVHKRISDEVGCAVGEALGGTPSLPGWRLHNALRRVLVMNNITLMDGRARGNPTHTTRVQEVSVGSEQVRARSFVLASGKFVGCGIAAGPTFREDVFDCPIWMEHLGASFDGPDPLILTDPVRTEDQPLLRAGVHTNELHQPVDRVDDVVYENVFLAGSIRCDWTAKNYGVGDCAEDGWRAGLLAVKS